MNTTKEAKNKIIANNKATTNPGLIKLDGLSSSLNVTKSS